MHEYAAGSATRGEVRLENAELRKWQKRVSSPAAWRKYSETKGAKLKQRIRDRKGLPTGPGCEMILHFNFRDARLDEPPDEPPVAVAAAEGDEGQDGIGPDAGKERGATPS